MLNLARLPLPRIGSWTVDDRDYFFLPNCPFTYSHNQLENLQTQANIPGGLTYIVLDVITCVDNRLRYQPNSIHDKKDGEMQLAALAAMRGLPPKFTDRRLRSGPFVFSLTDFHQSNIMVDDDWRITHIIDVEWACTLPAVTLGPPHWLSDRSLEQISFHFDEYAELHKEFVDITIQPGDIDV